MDKLDRYRRDRRVSTVTAAPANAPARHGAAAGKDHRRFTNPDEADMTGFGFSFMMVIKGLSTDRVMQTLPTRLFNDRNPQFAAACALLRPIAPLRLREMLP